MRRYQAYRSAVNQYLEALDLSSHPEPGLGEAMAYSLRGEGKRLRPVLALAVCEHLGGCLEDVLPFACAIEMIHTSALIHDDIMDEDTLRRGRPTNHVRYGVRTAILAGDALLNLAYEHMLEHILRQNPADQVALRTMAYIMTATGARGVMGGQMLDCALEAKPVDLATMYTMYRLKTGGLITAAVLSGAWLCHAPEATCQVLQSFSDRLGMAFQIKDDLLNYEGDPGVIGKDTGGDHRLAKATIVERCGVARAHRALDDLVRECRDLLKGLNPPDYFLQELVGYVRDRER